MLYLSSHPRSLFPIAILQTEAEKLLKKKDVCGVLDMGGSILLFTPVEKEKARIQLIRNSRAPYGLNSVERICLAHV